MLWVWLLFMDLTFCRVCVAVLVTLFGVSVVMFWLLWVTFSPSFAFWGSLVWFLNFYFSVFCFVGFQL